MQSNTIMIPPWLMKPGAIYYFINYDGLVDEDRWCGKDEQYRMYKFGNVFRTVRKAEQTQKIMKRMLRGIHVKR